MSVGVGSIKISVHKLFEMHGLNFNTKGISIIYIRHLQFHNNAKYHNEKMW